MRLIPENILLILKSLPEKPGVYRFLDETGTIIYVGKAKRLRRRVSSYFTKEHDSSKVRMLVTKIRDIQTTVVDTEWEALLLENSMIKQFKPRYNIMLKDDKSYPWIAVTKEEFPRVYPTRHPEPENMRLFGPYASVKHMNALLDTINDLFMLRTCRRLVHQERPCMQYQLKKCPAPCCGNITAAEYQQNIERIVEIIKGNRRQVIAQLKEEMMAYADRWEFEQSAVLKRKIESLEQFVAKSVVVNPQLTEMDVFGMEDDGNCAYVSFLRIVDGAIVQAQTLEIEHALDRNREDLLWDALLEMRDRLNGLFPTVIVPFLPTIEQDDWTFLVLVITGITSRKADNQTYFTGNRKSPWFVVAYGMIGSSLSGVTFMSVPGDVYTTQFTYLGVVLGYILGYVVIGMILLPLYYKSGVTSIYEYLGSRIGNEAHKTGSVLFFVSRLLGSALRMYLVIFVLQVFVFDGWHIPIWLTAIVMICIILLYTFRGGLKTVVWTDMLQTTFLIGALVITIIVIMKDMGGSFSELWQAMSAGKCQWP